VAIDRKTLVDKVLRGSACLIRPHVRGWFHLEMAVLAVLRVASPPGLEIVE